MKLIAQRPFVFRHESSEERPSVGATRDVLDAIEFYERDGWVGPFANLQTGDKVFVTAYQFGDDKTFKKETS